VGLYYYLVAQLPTLFYDQKQPMSSEDFKELAISLLSKKDAALLKHLSYEYNSDLSGTGCKFIDNWKKWEHTLRLNLAKQRSLKLYNKTIEDVPVIPDNALHTAEATFLFDGSPLEAEIQLDKSRWNVIDSFIEGYDYFDRSSVYAYYLKLLLLERRQLFNAENGFSEYKSLYAEILENGKSCVLNSTEETK
jgi:hypothetical protein